MEREGRARARRSRRQSTLSPARTRLQLAQRNLVQSVVVGHGTVAPGASRGRIAKGPRRRGHRPWSAWVACGECCGDTSSNWYETVATIALTTKRIFSLEKR